VTTVLGVGNEWRRDDAAGLEVARRLRPGVAPGVRVLEREGEPSGLLDAWEAEREVVLVDAVSSGTEPGTVHRIDALAAPLSAELFRGSTHHLSVAEAVEIGRALGRLPHQLEIYAIEGRDFTAGSGLTTAVERAVEQVAVELRERLAGAP
jgi:hydrogenase maturation protease